MTASRRVATGIAPETVQTCPLCLSAMELRRAGSAQQAGTWFWGCTRFPHCRGMISAPQPAPARVDASPAPAVRAVSGARRTRSRLGLFTLALVLILITLVAIILLGVMPTLVLP